MPLGGPNQTAFRYHYALVCRIPNSFAEHAMRSDSSVRINTDKARAQHEEYIETLRKLGIDVLELPADERHPDCVFVEDTAVIINGTALITKPRSQSRLGETAIIRQTLRKELGLKIVEVDSERAYLEGGDVLFTGKEIIVGVGGRTNMEGAQAVAKAFPEYATTVVNVPENILHLKSLIGVAGADVLVVSRTPEGVDILRSIMKKATFNYQVIRVDENNAANVIYANGGLIHLSENLIPQSYAIWESKFDNRIAVDIEEIGRAEGRLTSCVLLISKMRTPKSFVTTLEGGHHELE